MAKYRIIATTFLEPTICVTGDIVNWDGPPNAAMQPLDEEARVAYDKYLEEHAIKRVDPDTQRGKVEVLAPAPAGPVEKTISQAQAVITPPSNKGPRPGPATPPPADIEVAP